MKLKYLLDLLECDFTVTNGKGKELYRGNKHNIDGHNPRLKEMIVTAIADDMEFIVMEGDDETF